MDHTLTAVDGQVEQINRRYAGTQHRVLWNGEDLECHVDFPARRPQASTELRAAVDALIDAGCVRQPTAIEESSAEVIFYWDRVGKLTHPWEWPAEGWRAAAITSLRALEVLRRKQLTLRSSPHGDLFMVGSRPTIMSLGNLARWSEDMEARFVERIERLYIRPLECAAHGRSGLARRVFRSDAMGLSAEDRNAIVGQTATPRSSRDIATTLAWLSELELALQSAKGESWKTYEGRMTHWRAEEIAAKSAAVLAVIDRMRPASVLDIGCNLGLFSQLAATEGALVTGLDSDEDCLNLYFTRALEWKNPATAILMDLSDPSPTRGWGNGWSTSAGSRLSSDMVIALALIHHLAQGARLRAEELRECFASLTKRWLLLEFVPVGPTNPFKWGADFYSLEWLLDTLGQQFVRRQSWPHGERDRLLLLFERRD
jgi:SAM-dependent methyltransferase